MSVENKPIPLGSWNKTFDKRADYVPVLSTFTNIKDIGQKIFSVKTELAEQPDNRYYKHLNKKSFARCVVLLFPVIGNILVGLYDLGKLAKNKIRINSFPKGLPDDAAIEKFKKSNNKVQKALINKENGAEWYLKHARPEVQVSCVRKNAILILDMSVSGLMAYMSSMLRKGLKEEKAAIISKMKDVEVLISKMNHPELNKIDNKLSEFQAKMVVILASVQEKRFQFFENDSPEVQSKTVSKWDKEELISFLNKRTKVSAEILTIIAQNPKYKDDLDVAHAVVKINPKMVILYNKEIRIKIIKDIQEKDLDQLQEVIKEDLEKYFNDDETNGKELKILASKIGKEALIAILNKTSDLGPATLSILGQSNPRFEKDLDVAIAVVKNRPSMFYFFDEDMKKKIRPNS